MRRTTLNAVIAVIAVVLCVALLVGTLGGLDLDGGILSGAGCDHINTTKEYTAQGALQHICTETCENCGKVIDTVSESHVTFISDIRETTVNGSSPYFHETVYECSHCHYTLIKYESHVYPGYNSVCMGCGAICQHPHMGTTPGDDGKIRCPDCTYTYDPTNTCEHNWEDSVCTICHERCTHICGMGYDDYGDPPYYYCYQCDYIRFVEVS